MKLKITEEQLKEIIVNSNLVDSVVPISVKSMFRNDITTAYSSIVLSLLNTRLNPESRDYKVLNTIINKTQEVVIVPEMELFIVKLSMLVRDTLSMMDINIDIEQLITDLNTVINNVAREGVLGIFAVMDVSTFNTFRKHIFAVSKEELSKDELHTYKKYMKTYIDWVINEPKRFRLAINTISGNTHKTEPINASRAKSILLDMFKCEYDASVLTVAVQLLICKNYWMVIPDETMVLKIRRRLGRFTDRLTISLYKPSEFKLKGDKNVR